METLSTYKRRGLVFQAHCLKWLGQLDEASECYRWAIEHTPTADFPEKKARLLKKAGRIQAAAEMMTPR